MPLPFADGARRAWEAVKSLQPGGSGNGQGSSTSAAGSMQPDADEGAPAEPRPLEINHAALPAALSKASRKLPDAPPDAETGVDDRVGTAVADVDWLAGEDDDEREIEHVGGSP